MERGYSQMEEFCEEFGAFFERIGLTRMAGRVFGLLVISPPHLSSGDLAERLGASKGSISETTRLLLRLGFIEAVTLPKERKRYFRIKVESAYRMMNDHIQLFSQLRRLMAMGAELIGDQHPERRMQMEELVKLLLLFEEKLKQVLESWNERKERKEQWEG